MEQHSIESLSPLIAQRVFSRFAAKNPGISSVLDALRTMNYAQIDTISVYWRAHLHILSQRSGTKVDEDLLNQLQGQDHQPRRIFEYWYHAAAFLPLEDLKFCLHRMKGFREKHHQWYGDNKTMVSAVLKRIETEGPLCSSDFTATQKTTGTGWWNWKPAKVAMDMLFHSGQLVVSHRKKFKKYYDRAERALPQLGGLALPSPEDQARYLLDTTLDNYPICRIKDISRERRWGSGSLESLAEAMVESGELVPLSLADSPDQ